MSLSRLLILSAITLTMAGPAYSLNTHSDDAADHRDNVDDERDRKKVKVTEASAVMTDFNDQDVGLKDNGDEKVNTRKRGRDNDLADDDESKKNYVDLKASSVAPVFKPLTGAQQSALIAQANIDDQTAQDEVAARFSRGLIKGKITLNTWGALQEKAKDNDLYSFLLLRKLDAAAFAKTCPNLIADITLRGKQGNPFAQFNLGTVYWNGHGMLKDPAKAVEWWLKAAEQGFALAQSCLGKLYIDGNGVVKNPAKALEWWQKSAEQGFAVAQNKLGVAYGFGNGVVKDPVKELEWFRKAAKQGYAAAVKNVKQILIFQPEASMTSESLVQKATDFFEVITQMAAHSEQKMITNCTKFFREVLYAHDRLSALYSPVYEFGNKLSPLLSDLMKLQPGFMVSCIKPTYGLVYACAVQNPTSLLIKDDTITFGESNVLLVARLQDYLKILPQEFNKARRGLDIAINSLYPVAAWHACQQAIFSAQEELKAHPGDTDALHRLQAAEERLQQEKNDYDTLMQINQIEIDILTGFQTKLDKVEQGMVELIPSTIGSRNKAFIDSAEFSYLKP